MMEAVAGAFLGAAKLAIKLVLIIVPLVTVFELVRYHPVFRRAGDAVDPFLGKIGLRRETAVPLFTGIFLGIAYGAGIIIRAAREGRVPQRDLFLAGLFLGTCHAVVEDTLIFVAVGGNAWVMLGARVFLALFLTALLSRVWKPSPG